MPTMKVYRDSGYADHLRPYRLILDGNEIGEISDAENKSFDIPAGAHQLVAKIDWCGSPTVEFVANEGADVIFMVKSNLRGIRIFAAPYFVKRAKDAYLGLRQVSNLDVKGIVRKPLNFSLRRAIMLGAAVWGLPFALAMMVSHYFEEGVLMDPVRSVILLLTSLAGGMVFGAVMRLFFRRRYAQILEKMKAGQPPAT